VFLISRGLGTGVGVGPQGGSSQSPTTVV